MKTLRICLLVWLVLLLSARGVMAAAMLCPSGGTAPAPVQMHQATGEHATSGHAHMDHGMHHGMNGPMHSGTHEGMHHADTAADAADPHAAPDSCSLCCDFCASTPVAGTLAVLPTSPVHATLSFPELCTPAPSHISSGQERPPRST